MASEGREQAEPLTEAEEAELRRDWRLDASTSHGGTQARQDSARLAATLDAVRAERDKARATVASLRQELQRFGSYGPDGGGAVRCGCCHFQVSVCDREAACSGIRVRAVLAGAGDGAEKGGAEKGGAK